MSEQWIETRNGRTVRKVRYTVKLECGCMIRSYKKSGHARCKWHNGGEPQPIVGHFSQEWHARCLGPGRNGDGCRFSKWTAQSKIAAEHAANQHAGPHPERHNVVVLYDSLEHPQPVAKLRAGVYTREEVIPEWAQGPPPF